MERSSAPARAARPGEQVTASSRPPPQSALSIRVRVVRQCRRLRRSVRHSKRPSYALAEARPPSDLARRPLTHRMTRMASTSRRDFVRMSALAAAGVPLIRSPRLHSLHRASRHADHEPAGAEARLRARRAREPEHQPDRAGAAEDESTAGSPAIVTGTPAKAAKWKAQYGIPDKSIYNYETMGRMADNPDIDVVYIVTPNALHAATRSSGEGREARAVREADGGVDGAVPGDDRRVRRRRTASSRSAIAAASSRTTSRCCASRRRRSSARCA